MQNQYGSNFIRGISALVLGGLLIGFSAQMPLWLVMACGALFVLPGLMSLIAYFTTKKPERGSSLLTVVSVGSMLFGAILLIFPSLFITALMYILSVVLMVAAAAQTVTLWNMRSNGYTLSPLSYLVTFATFGAGLFVLLKPGLTAALPFIILGSASVFNGLLDLWTSFLQRKRSRRAVKPV